MVLKLRLLYEWLNVLIKNNIWMNNILLCRLHNLLIFCFKYIVYIVRRDWVIFLLYLGCYWIANETKIQKPHSYCCPFCSLKLYKSVHLHIRYFGIQSDKSYQNIFSYARRRKLKTLYNLLLVGSSMVSMISEEILLYCLNKFGQIEKSVPEKFSWGIINLCTRLQMHK